MGKLTTKAHEVMSEDFGKLFEEARQAKGLTLEDVAEALRVRAEYLEAIEMERFDFNLPDIYKRGFYKSYADFLGLDTEKMMALCPVKPFETLESTEKRREMVSQVAKKTQEVNLESIRTSFTDETLEPSEKDKVVSSQKKWERQELLKLVGIIGGALLVILLGISLVVHMVSSHREKPQEITESEFEEMIQKQFVLRAEGDVRIMVRGEETKEKIFSGILHRGDTQTVRYQMPVQLYFDHGESLTIELSNGETLHPDAGRGGIQIK